MQKIFSKFTVAIILSLMCLSAYLPSLASAQKNTISVSPAQLNFEINNTKQSTTDLLVSNSYDVPIVFSAEFKGIDKNSQLILPEKDLDNSLVGSLKLSETIFEVPANSSHKITVTVNDYDKLASGGHYATLVVSEKNSKKTSNSSISYLVSVGMFIVKRPGDVTKLSLKLVFPDHLSIFSLPQKVKLTAANEGNIHFVPRASVQIVDSGEKEVGRGVFNEKSSILLPGRAYDESVQLKYDHKSFFPEKLNVLVSYRVDGSDKIETFEKHFWHIPISFVVVSMITLLLGFLAVVKIHKSKVTTS